MVRVQGKLKVPPTMPMTPSFLISL